MNEKGGPSSDSGKAMRAAAWGYGGGVAKIVIQLVAQAVLARILGPSEYGVFAIGLMIVSLSIFFAESGTGAALIQRQATTPDVVAFAFSVQILVGAVVTLVVWFSSGLIASFYGEPRALEVVQALSVVVFITAASSISSSLLKKKLDFKNLQIGQVGGFFAGYVLVGIPAAMLGAGVWSLVLAWIVQSIVTTGYWYLKIRHPLILNFSSPEGRELLGFGGGTIVSNLATWAGGNVDKIVIGRMLPSATLGLYTVPFTFLGTLATQVLGTLMPVLFSASSRMTDDKRALRDAYLGLLEGASLFLLPMFITIAVIPDVVLSGIYGPLWISAAGIMQAAAICMATYVLGAIGTPILWALAQVKSEAKPQLLAAILIVIVSIPLSQYSASAVAWGVAAVSSGRMFWVISLVCRALDLRWMECLRALRPACIASAFCAVVAFALVNGSADLALDGIWLLALSIVGCFVALVFSVLMMRRRILSPALDARIAQVFRRFPRGQM